MVKASIIRNKYYPKGTTNNRLWRIRKFKRNNFNKKFKMNFGGVHGSIQEQLTKLIIKLGLDKQFTFSNNKSLNLYNSNNEFDFYLLIGNVYRNKNVSDYLSNLKKRKYKFSGSTVSENVLWISRYEHFTRKKHSPNSFFDTITNLLGISENVDAIMLNYNDLKKLNSLI